MREPKTSSDGRRWFAIGDPQTSEERFRAILGRHGLLAGGRIRDDVGLVSIGDHFDYGGDREEAARSGVRILSFLAEHPPDQVVILAGNHDVSRVTELAHEDEASFARARALADEIAAAEAAGAPAAEERARFAREFPRIPTPGLASRDYSTFTVEQRSLVQDLLSSGRMRLACTGRIGDAPVLLTHAGVTAREMALLDVAATGEAFAIATALEQRLRVAVGDVADRWARGERVALDLGPVHVAGTTGREGGGLLYHRPANPDREDATPWENDPVSPRRFDPRRLPRGITQVVGHCGHRKCVKELGPWVTDAARNAPASAIRTLRTDGTSVVYDVGPRAFDRGDAVLFMIDGEMNRTAPEEYELLQLDAVH